MRTTDTSNKKLPVELCVACYVSPLLRVLCHPSKHATPHLHTSLPTPPHLHTSLPTPPHLHTTLPTLPHLHTTRAIKLHVLHGQFIYPSQLYTRTVIPIINSSGIRKVATLIYKQLLSRRRYNKLQIMRT